MSGFTRRGVPRTRGATAAESPFEVRGAFAEELAATPRPTEGPFYPDRLPLDTDNDLLIANDSLTPAVGEITHLSGRVLTQAGSPVRGAHVGRVPHVPRPPTPTSPSGADRPRRGRPRRPRRRPAARRPPARVPGVRSPGGRCSPHPRIQHWSPAVEIGPPADCLARS